MGRSTAISIDILTDRLDIGKGGVGGEARQGHDQLVVGHLLTPPAWRRRRPPARPPTPPPARPGTGFEAVAAIKGTGPQKTAKTAKPAQVSQNGSKPAQVGKNGRQRRGSAKSSGRRQSRREQRPRPPTPGSTPSQPGNAATARDGEGRRPRRGGAAAVKLVARAARLRRDAAATRRAGPSPQTVAARPAASQNRGRAASLAQAAAPFGRRPEAGAPRRLSLDGALDRGSRTGVGSGGDRLSTLRSDSKRRTGAHHGFECSRVGEPVPSQPA